MLTEQYFISEEPNSDPVILHISLKSTNKQLNMTQQLLPSSETSLCITSATDLAHSEKQMKAVTRLLEMFSRVK
jgi:hypothetical protein